MGIPVPGLSVYYGDLLPGFCFRLEPIRRVRTFGIRAGDSRPGEPGQRTGVRGRVFSRGFRYGAGHSLHRALSRNRLGVCFCPVRMGNLPGVLVYRTWDGLAVPVAGHQSEVAALFAETGRVDAPSEAVYG